MGMMVRRLLALLLVAGALMLPTELRAADAVERLESGEIEAGRRAPVVVDGATLFRVQGSSVRPAAERADLIAGRITALAADPRFTRDSLRLESEQGVVKIMAGSRLIMAVYDADARVEGGDPKLLAVAIQQRVGDAIDAWRLDRTPEVLQRHLLMAVGATLALVVALWIGRRLFRLLDRLNEQTMRERVRDLEVRGFQIVGARQIWAVINGLLSLLKALVIVAALYIYLSSVLSLFPWTRGLALNLVEFLMEPLRTLGTGLIKSVPNLIFLAVLFFVLRYVLRMLRHFFDSIANGSVVWQDFEPDWADPTYRLVRFAVIAFGVIVAYPYIPGSGSEAFKGVSLFMGVVFSLGSSSVIGNIIAGYTMTYRRAFKVGDRVRIGEHVGNVEQIRILATQLRTLKNEMVTLPNSVVLNGEVVNFTTLASTRGVMVHTTVGIGYETPWRQVEAMLLEAARRTPGLTQDPPPFVLQKALGDFCVTYEINALCNDVQKMHLRYNDLHRNILDIFNEYGVQIMTPAYEGDPEQPKLVPREQWYAAPAQPPVPAQPSAQPLAPAPGSTPTGSPSTAP